MTSCHQCQVAIDVFHYCTQIYKFSKEYRNTIIYYLYSTKLIFMDFFCANDKVAPKIDSVQSDHPSKQYPLQTFLQPLIRTPIRPKGWHEPDGPERPPPGQSPLLPPPYPFANHRIEIRPCSFAPCA